MATFIDPTVSTTSGQCPRPSTLIAEALVERQSAREIVARACALGLPDPTMEVILAACGSTAGSTVRTTPPAAERPDAGTTGLQAR